MKILNEREQSIILKLSETDPAKPVSIQDFLKLNYFTEESGRALIIQNQGEYAVFFLKKELFEDEAKRTEEVKELFELISLLNSLNKNGYITIYKEKTEKMYFIQDGFNTVKNVSNTIVLNTKGDYTAVPDTIHDIQKNIIYKGIEFRADQYNLILDTTAGLLMVAGNILDLVSHLPPSIDNTGNKNKPVIQEHKKISVIQKAIFFLLMFVCLFLCAATAVVYVKTKTYDQYFSNLSNSHLSLKDSLKCISNSLNGIKTFKSSDPVKDTDEIRIHYGIDISKWNGNEASEIPTKDSITFIICKATEGVGYIDPEFRRNWEIIRSADFLLGAYHFYHTNEDPLKQVEHFWSTISSQGLTDMAPIVDIEQASLPENTNINPSTIQNNLLIFLKNLEQKCKRIPMIYTGAAFANQYLNNNQLARYPLWLAEYTNAPSPQIPKTWAANGYKIWQKRDNYFVDTHTTDLDVFYGKKSELIK
ncbi:MAG: hypothetical protein K0S32_1567 [Bacteroidetes bacterium]|jgi:GH25 family lysozyme M1 (1,4-beta-N-acetylmuramidase)|nr:hypothetical protein [Bacteroidota bacterium]